MLETVIKVVDAKLAKKLVVEALPAAKRVVVPLVMFALNAEKLVVDAVIAVKSVPVALVK